MLNLLLLTALTGVLLSTMCTSIEARPRGVSPAASYHATDSTSLRFALTSARALSDTHRKALESLGQSASAISKVTSGEKNEFTIISDDAIANLRGRKNAIDDLQALLPPGTSVDFSNLQCLLVLSTVGEGNNPVCLRTVTAMVELLDSSDIDAISALATICMDKPDDCFTDPATALLLASMFQTFIPSLQKLCTLNCMPLLTSLLKNCVVQNFTSIELGFIFEFLSLGCVSNEKGNCAVQLLVRAVSDFQRQILGNVGVTTCNYTELAIAFGYGPNIIPGSEGSNNPAGTKICPAVCKSDFQSAKDELGCCAESAEQSLRAYARLANGTSVAVPDEMDAILGTDFWILCGIIPPAICASSTDDDGGGDGDDDNTTSSFSKIEFMSAGLQLAIGVSVGIAGFILLFFIFGSIYKRFVHRVTGWDAIPFISVFRTNSSSQSFKRKPRNTLRSKGIQNTRNGFVALNQTETPEC